jgi:NADH-quinone oxidoreductase subunit N
MNSLANLGLALPELVLAGAGLLLLMIGVFSKGDATRFVGWLTVLVMVIAAGLVLTGPGEGQALKGLFVVDSFATFTKVLVLAASALSLILSLGWLAQEQMKKFEYSILVLFATLGMMMMISANDMMSLYLGLELQSLALYVVASFNRDSLKSTEAGLKYFVLGSVASGMLLYGVSMVYGFSGTTNFSTLAEVLSAGHPHTGVIVGLVFVMAGLAFKVSAAPFHMWTPDVYEGAPTPVTAFFALAPKIAAIALFTRVLTGPFADLIDAWQQIVWVIAILSMIVGSFGAIGQSNIKRLMAYSSIGHMGYALIGLVVGNEAGVNGVLIYLAVYIFMNIGAFAIILSMRQKGRAVEGISDLAGLSKTSPLMAAALAIFMFSMAGIPPMAGFFGKFYVFVAAVEAHMYGLAVIGVLTSVVGAYYYLRIVKLMYFDEPVEAFDAPRLANRLIVFGAGVFTLFYIVFPSPLLESAKVAAQSLFSY